MSHRDRVEFDPLLLGFPLLALLLEVLALPSYGWFRDELYYLACTEHLDFGYVDQPPLSIFVLWLVRSLFGASIWSVRLLPAIVLAIVVHLVGKIAGEMGGGRFARALAMLATLSAPIYLGLAHIYSMNVFDLLVWSLAGWLIVRLLNEGPGRHWIHLGVVLGLGLQNKISVLWLGAGLLVGLLLTPARRYLRTVGPWAAGAIAVTLFLPHLVWQAAHHWPTLEFMRNAATEKMAALEVVPFLADQVLIMGPPAVWLWVAGLLWLLRAGGARYRVLAWTWLSVLVLLLLSGSARAYYLAPAYSWLLAAGAVATQRFLAGPWRRRLRPAALAMVASSLLLAPATLPLLPVPTYLRYAERLGIQPSTEERKELAELPQFYADMHGWEEIVETVAEVYQRLPAEERPRTTVYAQNYGVAGAVDLLGPPLGLPGAISGHNSYWLWGWGDTPISTVLIVGGDEIDHRDLCSRVRKAAVIDCGYCMPYENDQPVFVCRDLKQSPAEIWPRVKHFD